jgi:hypothetical protein
MPYLPSKRGNGVSTKRYLAGVVLAAAGAVLLLMPLGSAVGQLVSGISTSPVPPGGFSGADSSEPVPGSAVPGPPAPQLTPEQRSQAIEVVGTSDAAQHALADRAYDVGGIVPWTIDRPESFEVFGAVVTVRLDQPASYSMQAWPLVDPNPGADTPYREINLHMEASNVTELLISVDLRRDEVVSVDPNGPNLKVTPGQDMLAMAASSRASAGD